MKTLLAVVLVAVATAAPVENGPEPAAQAAAPALQLVPLLREKRSGYGAVYSPPCAAALPHLGPAYGLPGLASHAAYGYNPHPGYQASYGGPHYRADDQMTEDGEMMSFSDMDHVTMARSYGYGGPAQYGGNVYGAGAGGPAVGVFPNAHVSGCNVPLLLSCSPSIVAGKIVGHPGYGGAGYGGAGYGGVSVVAAGAGGYRGADDHHPAQEEAEETHHDEHLQPHHEQRISPQDSGHAPAMHS